MKVGRNMTFLGYLLAALVPCAVIVVLCFIFLKRDNAKLEDLLQNVSDEDKERLKNMPYTKKDGLMYVTDGLVADIREDKGKANVYLLFYNSPRGEFYDQKAKLSSDELRSRGISKGGFIPCLMKFDGEYQIFGFKKIV